MKRQNDSDFINNNMYTGKGSKSVYSPMYSSFFLFAAILIISAIYYYEFTKLESGESIRINAMMGVTYDLFGIKGGIAVFVIIGLLFIGFGYYMSMKKKQLKEETLANNRSGKAPNDSKSSSTMHHY